jgi:hypothetical protein
MTPIGISETILIAQKLEVTIPMSNSDVVSVDA